MSYRITPSSTSVTIAPVQKRAAIQSLATIGGIHHDGVIALYVSFRFLIFLTMPPLVVRSSLLFYYSDKLNPRVYNRVKSIDLELGGSDDEDIASKTTLVIRGP